jgi:hypothetical protein
MLRNSLAAVYRVFLIVTASFGKTARPWDAAAGKELAPACP